MGAFQALAILAPLGLVAAQTAITVNLSQTYQQIDGFGFSRKQLLDTILTLFRTRISRP